MALVPPPVTQPASAEIGTVDRVTITQTRKAVIHVIRPQGWGDAEITLAVANRMPDLIARAEWWDAEVETDGASIAKSTDDRKMESEDGGPPQPDGCLIELSDRDLMGMDVTIEPAPGGAA